MKISFYGATAAAEQEANRLLGLDASGAEQDWEFEFADPAKIDSILKLLETGGIDQSVRSALCLLLLASIDEALDGEGVSGDRQARVLLRMSDDPVVLEQMKFYWIELGRAIHKSEIKELLEKFDSKANVRP